VVPLPWWNWVARQKIDPHLPIHGLRDSFGTWVYETYGVKQAQEWLGTPTRQRRCGTTCA
jgi:integrase